MAYAGFCQRGSRPSLFQQTHRDGDKFSNLLSRIFAVEKLPRRRRKNYDASTNPSNNFGVSRKRFKPSTLGSIET